MMISASKTGRLFWNILYYFGSLEQALLIQSTVM